MPETTPLITTIVVTYNAAKTLQGCIDSVAAQTHPNKELVVVDGGSTDGSVEILKANEEKMAYWESEPDRGIFHAWNKALDHTSGDWVYFLGADDYFWQEDVLERLAPHLNEAAVRGIRVVYGRVASLNADGGVEALWGWPWEETAKSWFRQDMSIAHQGALHHKSLFEVHGRFDESFKTAADYDMLLRELKTRDAVFVPGVIVAGMRTGGISTTPANGLISIREAARVRRKNGLRGFSPALFKRGFGTVRGLVRARLFELLGARTTNVLLDVYRISRGKSRKWTRKSRA